VTQAIPAGGDSHSARRDRGLRLLILNWRDTEHPYGGGSEVYAEHIADGLARIGHEVTLFTARYPGSAARETRPSGVTVVRAGGQLSVYVQAWWQHLRGRLGQPEIIVRQNGMPFWRLRARRIPVMVFVHHVHRRQWRSCSAAAGRPGGGWNRRLRQDQPRRPVRHRLEVSRHGSSSSSCCDDIEVIHNGTASRCRPSAQVSASVASCSPPRPAQRVEIALDTVAALRGRRRPAPGRGRSRVVGTQQGYAERIV
jgi:hypothetical protein